MLQKKRMLLLTILTNTVMLLALAATMKLPARAAEHDIVHSRTVVLPQDDEPEVNEWPAIELQRLNGHFRNALYVTHAGDGSNRLFVVDKLGAIFIHKNGERLPTAFLDIRDRVQSECPECGLLGLAFPPDFAENQYFFVYYNSSEEENSSTYPPEPDAGYPTVLARYFVGDDPDVADPDSEEKIIVFDQPRRFHNGGQLAFGPDGYLYISKGDAGMGVRESALVQTPTSYLGKILRIQIGMTGTYTIPPDNPFVGPGQSHPEIWALGLRNPWRFSFDRQTGDLYIADVGQTEYEEINFAPATSSGGENYGWPIMEGNQCYDANECDQDGMTLPVVAYAHDGHCSVIGGYVYRGPSFPALDGIYLYSDYCSGTIWGLRKNGEEWETQTLYTQQASAQEWGISSLGEDEQGNLFVVNVRGFVDQIVDASVSLADAVMLTHTVDIDPDGCGVSSSITVTPGTHVYHCVQLTNRGVGTATDIQLVSEELGLNRTFTATLEPDSTYVFTHATFAELGPLQALTDIVQSITVSTTLSTLHYSQELSATAEARVFVADSGVGRWRIYIPKCS